MNIYLYVKTHQKTGLKYLGMTTKFDPHKYKGSGKLWKQHLKEYGNSYTTEILLGTTDKEEIIKLVVGKNPDSIGMGPDMGKFKENPPEEIRKEAFNLIKSAAKMGLQDWSLDKVKQTGNMGDLSQVFGTNSGRGGWKGKLKLEAGVEGITKMKELIGSSSEPGFDDTLKAYLRNFDELVNEKSITKPAPFIINLKNTDGKPYHLIGGHKRSTIALQLGIPVKALFIEF